MGGFTQKAYKNLSYYVVFLAILVPAYAVITNLIASIFITNLKETSFYTAGIMILFSFPLAFMIKKMRLSKKEIGFTLKGCKGNVLKSVLISVVFCILALLLELILIKYFTIFNHLKVFRDYEKIGLYSLLPVICVYIVFSFLQTLITNCAIQAPILIHIQFKRKGLISIVVSGVLFSYLHITLGFTYFTLVIVPIFLWSWMFVKYKSVLPVYISHVIIGVWCFFSLSYIDMISALQNHFVI